MVAAAAMTVVTACVIFKGVVGHEVFPWWAEDPTVIALPVTGLLPAASIMVSMATIVAAMVATLALGWRAAGRTAAAVQVGLALAGSVTALSHGAWIGGGSIENAVTGMGWIAAISAGLAAVSAKRDAVVWRVMTATLVAGLVMVAAKCAVQTFIEHPATVASFKSNKAAILASHGWNADSQMARAFEHRLMQPDATGWFGLSNVVSTLGAGAAVMAAGLFLATRADRERPADGLGVWGVGLAGLAGVGMLALGGSKGGYAGAMIGAGVLGLAWLARRKPGVARLARWAPLAVILAVVAGVIVRGVVGDRLGERSVLFRSYYLEATWRIVRDAWLWGTGPEGYKSAYMIAKNPLNPEEISSPHNVVADFVSMLGLAGAAWSALWVLWVAGLGRGLVQEHTEVDEVDGKREVKPIFLSLSMATIGGAWHELASGTPESSLLRIVGLAGAVACGAGLVRALSHRGAGAAVAAGGVTLAALCMIDMAGTHAGSAAWVMMLIGAGVGVTPRAESATSFTLERVSRGVWIGAASGVAALACVGAMVVGPWIAAWQGALRSAFDAVAGPARLQMTLDELARGVITPGSMEAEDAVAQLRGAGLEPGMSEQAVARKFEDLRIAAGKAAMPDLEAASLTAPTHDGTREAASRLQMQLAALLKAHGEEQHALEAASNALALAAPLTLGRRVSASTRLWQGTVIEAVSRMRNDPQHLWTPQCIAAWKAAHEADPYGIQAPMKLAELYAEIGPAEDAAAWAEVALRADGWNRMDPSGTRALTDPKRRMLEGLVKKGRTTDQSTNMGGPGRGGGS